MEAAKTATIFASGFMDGDPNYNPVKQEQQSNVA